MFVGKMVFLAIPLKCFTLVNDAIYVWNLEFCIYHSAALAHHRRQDSAANHIMFIFCAQFHTILKQVTCMKNVAKMVLVKVAAQICLVLCLDFLLFLSILPRSSIYTSHITVL